VSPTDSKWRPKVGLVIQLWKLDVQGHPELLSGIPKHVPFYPILGNDVSKSVKKEIFINNGILKYFVFWKFNILKDEMYA
jgi:hypothetical protein